MTETKQHKGAIIAVLMFFVLALSAVGVSLLAPKSQGTMQSMASVNSFSAQESGFASISAMGQDAEFIYMVSLASPTVRSYNKETSEITELFTVPANAIGWYFDDIIVTDTHIFLAMFNTGEIVVYDKASETFEILDTGLRAWGEPTFASFVADETHLYINGWQGGFTIFDKATRTFTQLPTRTGALAGFTGRMWDDGENIYIGGGSALASNSLSVFNKATRTFTLKAMPNASMHQFTRAEQIIGDEDNLYILRASSGLYVYNRENGTAILEQPAGTTMFTTSVLTQCDNFVYTGGNQGRFAIFNKSTGIFQAVDIGHTFNITGIVVSGSFIYLGGSGGQFVRIPHPELREFSVTFVDRDNNEILSNLFAENTIVRMPSSHLITPPRILGYAFSHWELVTGNDIGERLTANTIFRAVYVTTDVFTVTFLYHDNTVHHVAQLNAGERIASAWVPGVEREGYMFVSWEHVSGDEHSMIPITQNTVFRATYIRNVYTIRFYDNTGRISSEFRSHGWVVEMPEFIPRSFIENGYLHTFSHWESNNGQEIGQPLTQNTNFNAVFDQELMTWSVLFRCEFNRDTIAIVSLKHGDIIEAIPPPQGTGANGGAFSHWELIDGDNIGQPITQPTRFRAVFHGEGVENLATLVLMFEGSVFANIHLPRGTILQESHIPELPSWDESFVQWTWELNAMFGQPLTQTLTVMQLIRVERNHEVLLFDINGNFFTGFMIAHGETLIINNPAPLVVGKTFLRWERVSGDNLGSPATQNSAFRAIYEINIYTIKFILHGEVVFEGKLTHGTIITINITPENYRTDDYIFTFVRWFCNDMTDTQNVGYPITRNVVFTAVFDQTPIPYFTVRFYDAMNRNIREFTVRDGTVLTQEMLPVLDDPRHPFQNIAVFDQWGTQDGRIALGMTVTSDTNFMAFFRDGRQMVEIAFRRTAETASMFDFTFLSIQSNRNFDIIGNGFNFNTSTIIRGFGTFNNSIMVFRVRAVAPFELTNEWQDLSINANINSQIWGMVEIRLSENQDPNASNPPIGGGTTEDAKSVWQEFTSLFGTIGIVVAVIVALVLLALVIRSLRTLSRPRYRTRRRY